MSPTTYLSNAETRRSDPIAHRSRARTENSLLRSKHQNEQVTWIGGVVPEISFGELVHASEPDVAVLAKSLDLPPGGEDVQFLSLNEIFRHLGVSRADFRLFLLLIHQVTIHAFTDPVSCHPFEDRRLVDAQRNKPWMIPIEASLYVFLAYLTMFVYSSVVL